MGGAAGLRAQQRRVQFREAVHLAVVLLALAFSSPVLADGISAQQSENSVVQIAVAVPGGAVTNFGPDSLSATMA